MIYFKKQPEYLKIKEVATMLNVDQVKLYEWVEDIERYGVTSFHKTPFGSTLIEKDQVGIVEEYINMRNIFNTPKEASIVVKSTSTFQSSEEEDFSWADQLKQAIWRRH